MENERSCAVKTTRIGIGDRLASRSALNVLRGGETVTDVKNGQAAEASVPTASLESILCTEESRNRLSRAPDFEKENRALVKLANALADSPSTIFQTLAVTIQEITQCDSAGLSLLTRDGKKPDVDGQRFYWPAICGRGIPM